MEAEDSLAHLTHLKQQLESGLKTASVSDGDVLPIATVHYLTGAANSLRSAATNFNAHKAALLSAVGRKDPRKALMLERRIERTLEDAKLLLLTAERVVGNSALEESKAALLAGSRKRTGRGDMTAEQLAAEEAMRLEESSIAIAEMIGQGRATVSNLVGQRQYVTSARKRLQSAFLSMGVSASVLSSAEGRVKADQLIVKYGLIAISIFVYLFYHWWKGYHPFWWFPSFMIPSFLVPSYFK